MLESLRNGFMAVFAVSGCVVFIAMHAHNRLLSNFIQKIEFDIKNSTFRQDLEYVLMNKMANKKVRFADYVMVESAIEGVYDKNHRRTADAARRSSGEILEAMPQNWQVLYKGILHRRNLRGINDFSNVYSP